MIFIMAMVCMRLLVNVRDGQGNGSRGIEGLSHDML
jgi:hypothetical protein